MLTKEQMADVLVEEMLDDLRKIVESFESFADRFTQYAKQYAVHAEDAVRKREPEMKSLLRRLEKLTSGD